MSRGGLPSKLHNSECRWKKTLPARAEAVLSHLLTRVGPCNRPLRSFSSAKNTENKTRLKLALGSDAPQMRDLPIASPCFSRQQLGHSILVMRSKHSVHHASSNAFARDTTIGSAKCLEENGLPETELLEESRLLSSGANLLKTGRPAVRLVGVVAMTGCAVESSAC